MTDSSEDKKIIIDEDWKTQVEAEKVAAEATREESAANPTEDTPEEAPSSSGPSSSDGEATALPLPPADFTTIVSMLATQAMLNLGTLPNPMNGKTDQNLPQAKHAIDLIEVLQEKTKGNCNPQEEMMLQSLLHELRMAYVASQDQSSSKEGEQEKH